MRKPIHRPVCVSPHHLQQCIERTHFGRCARRAEQSGCLGVEKHLAHCMPEAARGATPHKLGAVQEESFGVLAPARLRPDVGEEVVGDEGGRADQESLDHCEVDAPEDRGEHRLVELVEGLAESAVAPSSLARNRNYDLCSRECERRRDQAEMRHACLHHEHCNVGVFVRVCRLGEASEGECVPNVLREAHSTVQLQLECVECTHLDPLVLLHIPPAQPQLAGLRVKADLLHLHCQVELDALRVARARGELLVHLALRARAHQVALGYEVVQMPQIVRLLHHHLNGARAVLGHVLVQDLHEVRCRLTASPVAGGMRAQPTPRRRPRPKCYNARC
mmetsp:Transcript_36386/g.85435  ORF Transcript_36386/g.85435 Transcript_36386/m.85435 type:complete len:334 (+) Transcript_36386:501-1502(+)